MKPPPGRIVLAVAGLSLIVGLGCSDRPAPKVQPKARVSDFRKIRFANDWVVVSFRDDLKPGLVPEAVPGFVPKVGDRVVLSDAGDGEVILAGDLDALKFYHSSPTPEQIGRFRLLADERRLFIVARGTPGTILRVVEGALPEGLRAVELKLSGDPGGVAWVGEPFIRRVEDPEE